MISIVNYIYENKITEHLKKHKGKYLAGAGIGLATAALAPEAYAQYHGYMGDKETDRLSDTLQKQIGGSVKNIVNQKLNQASSIDDKDITGMTTIAKKIIEDPDTAKGVKGAYSGAIKGIMRDPDAFKFGKKMAKQLIPSDSNQSDKTEVIPGQNKIESHMEKMATRYGKYHAARETPLNIFSHLRKK